MLNRWNPSLKSSDASLYRGHPASGSSDSTMLSNYEISDDLTRARIQCLERKYEGRLRAHNAATKIQRAYRHYRLCQQWKHVVSQAPNSSRLQKCIYATGSNGLSKFISADGSRGNHLRKLAQSQPSLKYQPLTSLTAQLRAERDGSSPLCSPTTSSADHDSSKDTHDQKKSQTPKAQQYDYLVSPRLSQKRLNLTLYQQHKSDNSGRKSRADDKNSDPATEPTTIVLYDSDREEESTAQGLLSVSSATTANFNGTRGYHRSVSPHSHFASHNGNGDNYATHSKPLDNFGQQLTISDASPSNNHNHRQKDIRSRINCVPRLSDGSIAYHHRGHNWQFDGNVIKISAGQFYSGKPISLLPYQLTPANIINYNANSLPRVSKKHIPRDESAVFIEANNSVALVGSDHRAVIPTAPRIHNRANSFTRRGASPTSLSNRRAASRDQLNIYSVENHTNPRDQQPAIQSRPDARPQMRGWRDLYRRRLYRIALNFFNKKPDRGIQLLISWGFVDNNPRSIARLFLERRGLSKQKIGEFLGTIKSPFHYAILESFIDEIPMYNMDIDKALRQLLVNFRLPGEAQKIDHIMQVFAARYRFCNPERFPPEISSDTLYILAFAIIMLNTDLHTPSLKDSKRMKLDEFIKNICGINEGQLLDKKMLQGIYERVKEHEFRTGADHVTQVMKVDQSIIGKDKPKLVEPHRRLICYCRLNQVPDPNKKQALNVHQREVFLFNDIMVVAKIFSKRKSVGQYTLRYWTPLIGIRVESFQNAFYNFGLVISCPDGQDLVFNAKNADDRLRFMADIKESVLESTEMEQLRIELELGKQNANCMNTLFDHFDHGKYSGEFIKQEKQSDDSNNSSAQRDSGLPELDQPCSSAQQNDSQNVEDDVVLAEDSINPKSSYVQLQQLREKSSIMTFNSTNSVTSAFSAGYVTTSDCSNSGTPLRKPEGGYSTPTATRFFDRHNVAGAGRMTPGSIQNHCMSSARTSNGLTAATTAAINNSAPPGARRLSFNSLDSGMVEESVDYPT